MTAFAGVIYPDALQISDITSLMLGTMGHRASTEKHLTTFRNIQIGCLCQKPATNAKKDLFLLFDGEIDNIEKLREEFGEDKSPEELIITLYELFGEKFLERLDGEFALALLDQRSTTLLLARDRVGKKPLYWYQDKKYFLFASELKALLSSGLVPQTPCPEALASYLFFGYSPQDLTPVKDCNKLLPSHYLIHTPSLGIRLLPYWSYSSYFEKRLNIHKSKVVSQIDFLLESAVKVRIPESGPLGCFVSGGLGSATIAYYISKLAEGHPLKGFTASFKEHYQEDLQAALSVCKSLNLPNESTLITQDLFLNEFPKIAWYLDEPIADPNVMATWSLSKLARGFSKTVYSGMGSDELLAGHSRYSLAERDQAYVSRLMLLPRPLLQKILIPFLKVLYPDAAFNLLRTMKTNPWQFEFLRHNAIFDESALGRAAPKLAECFDPDTFLHKFHNLSRIQSNVSAFLYFDVKTRLPDCFILQYERMTRAFGLNWETPFLDRSLIEFAAKLPEPESLAESETASYLKPLVRSIFAPEMINRPKKTRKQFLSGWAQSKEIMDIFRLLSKGTLLETGFVSGKWLDERLETPETIQDSFRELYTILSLEVWFRLFINKPPGTHPPETTLKELLLQR